MAIRKIGKVWQVDVTFGRSGRKRENLPTYEAAKRRENELQGEYLKSKKLNDGRSLSFGRALARYLAEVEGRNEPKTLEFRKDLLTPMTHTLGLISLDVLGRREVFEYLAAIQKREKRPVSAGTARKALAELQTFLRWAVSNRLIKDSDLLHVPLPKTAPVHRREALDWGEVQTIYSVAKTWRDRGILLLMAEAGLRRDEVRNFALDWIKPGERAIVIPAWAEFRPKNKRPRQIPMSPALEEWAADWPEGRLYLLDGSRTIYPIRRLTRKAGELLERRVHPHLLRHSYASHLVTLGASLADIQAILGHSDIATTARYIHTLRGHVERVRSLWSSVTTSVTTKGQNVTTSDYGASDKREAQETENPVLELN